MKSTKKKAVIRKEDGTIVKNNKSWTEAGLQKYKEYQSTFVKESYRTFLFRVRNDRDAAIIKFCEEQNNFTGLMTSLIRNEMMRQGLITEDIFESDENIRIETVVKYHMASGKINAAEYIVPELTNIPQKNPKYNYEVISSDESSITVRIEYDPKYSTKGVIAEIGVNLEAYIQKKCSKILTQFGINPVLNIFDRKYTIESQDLKNS